MRLPESFCRMEPAGAVLRAIEAGEAVMAAACGEKNDQLCVGTATEGLRIWEADYGLADGRGADEVSRRRRIHAAMLGGQTLTVAALKQMAVTLNGADEGEVDEDFAHHHVTLTAIYKNRKPQPVTPALREAVERFKPAHLTVDVVSAARLRGELNRYHVLRGKVMLTLPGQRTN